MVDSIQMIVEVRGGNVVEVYSDQPVLVRILDWDNLDKKSDDSPLAHVFGPAAAIPSWLSKIGRTASTRNNAAQ